MKMNTFLFQTIIHFILYVSINNSNANDDTSLYTSILKWATSKNLFISPLLTMNFHSVNNRSFIANDNIPFNTTILSIPNELFLNINTTLKLCNNKHKQLYTNLISIFNNNYTRTYTTASISPNATFVPPQLKPDEIFLAFMQSISIPYNKGKIYKKYKPYFNTYQTNLDSYPIYFTEEQMSLLLNTSIGSQIELAKYTLEEEAIHLKRLMNNSLSFNFEEYYKYRVLTVSKSVYHNNTVHLIPFIDFFDTSPYSYMVDLLFDNNAVHVVTTRDVSKDENIVLKSFPIPNGNSLMFYGKTNRNVNTVQSYSIPIIHPLWISEYNLKTKGDKLELDDDEDDRVELVGDYFYKKSLNKYKKVCKYIGIDDSDLNAYGVMFENLNRFRKDYLYLNDYMYGKAFYTKRDAINVKRVVDVEKKIISDKVNYVKEIVKALKSIQLEQNEDL
jgi:hypothetical protein